MALGHAAAADGDAVRHLASCGRCCGELVRFERVVTAAREVEEPDLPAPPAEHVWQAILRELAFPSGEKGPPG